jgi:hypothetical protein
LLVRTVAPPWRFTPEEIPMNTRRKTLRKTVRKSGKPSGENALQGEGNYEAAREYNEATRDFVQSGRVEKAARDAEPRGAAEAMSMEQAEQAGKERAKGEDPAVTRDKPAAPSKRY